MTEPTHYLVRREDLEDLEAELTLGRVGGILVANAWRLVNNAILLDDNVDRS